MEPTASNALGLPTSSSNDDSSGNERKYPGIDIDVVNGHRQWGEGYNYPVIGQYDETILPLREIFMMTLMDRLTDKPGWEKKVFGEDIVSKWRKEALEQSERELFDEILNRSRQPANRAEGSETEGEQDPELAAEAAYWNHREPKVPFPRCRIISERCFDYCIQELQDKAKHFEKTGFVPTLDAIDRLVVKSDTLVPDGLRQELVGIFDELRADQARSEAGLDWHPNTDEKVLDLVHPSLYPFVYGRSPFIPKESVSVVDAVERFAGKIPVFEHPGAKSTQDEWHQTWRSNPDTSDKYQWLPANLKFREDGSVEFTSYINNLHPRKYPHVYRALEKLIDLSIPTWNQILVEGRRSDSRFKAPTYAQAKLMEGVDSDTETEGLWEELEPDVLAKFPFTPTDDRMYELRDFAADHDWSEEEDEVDEGGDEAQDVRDARLVRRAERHKEEFDQFRWNRIKDAIYPEPEPYEPIDYACKDDLRGRMAKLGLQVIVKMARIELTPEKPEFPAGSWHLEGMLNERICATALYYLDSENITPSSLVFRTETDRDPEYLHRAAGQDAYNWLERIYGVDFQDDVPLQMYGRVETRQGRLLAFPNAFQHRVSSFKLKDPTKPGHRSFVALWLVDPENRVVSTANVPPQQLDWWNDAIFKDGTNTLLSGKMGVLPPELRDQVHAETMDGPPGLMSLEEAKHHRLELMRERTTFGDATNDGPDDGPYNFCEH